ncbi:uncharacterized protein LOC110982927 [Acanthaster planci]|uniref:Uncharacterized protein LOC110982927 n=1 Tax=Acanthaster planci TaxID=133434 RepID=A0A8B7YVT1_ACAPL|nr:uncharacterized protein LOC110982927 [Acanthaster planci]XP_022097420.1 uncharacterized protein LOC110982927 [Acanthaster planci]
MDTKHSCRSSRISAHLDAPPTSHLKASDGTPRAAESLSATLTTTDVNPAMYHNRNFSSEFLKYHTSATNAHKLRQLSVGASDFSSENVSIRGPKVPQDYHSRSMILGSAFTNQDLNWRQSFRDMPNELLSPKAVAVDQSKQWPINVTPKFEDKHVAEFHMSGACNQSLPSTVNQLQMRGRPDMHPYAMNDDRFAFSGITHASSLDLSCGRHRESAFSRPHSHAVSPVAYSSLDMEIRRLRGMITRVEMLREKYKYQEGTLQYPRPLVETYPQEVHSGPLSAVERNGLMPWYMQDQRQQVTCTENRFIHSRGSATPYQQDAPHLYEQKPDKNVNVQKQRVNRRARSATVLDREFQRAYLHETQKDMMPRIVDVRSLAHGDGQATYPEKPHRLHPEISQPKVPCNPKHSMRLSTDSRNETESVESLDSGVECMSSPTDIQAQRSLVYGYGRLRQMEDMYVKEEPISKLDSHQPLHYQSSFNPRYPCTSHGALYHEQSSDSPSSPLSTAKNTKKRVIQDNVVQAMAKKPKSGVSDLGADDNISKPISNRTHIPCSVAWEENDRALDLRLKKRHTPDRDDPNDSTRNCQMQTHSNPGNIAENGAIRLSMRSDTGVVVPSKISQAVELCADSCPGILHHHGTATSTEDLVALSVKLANEVPRGKGGKEPSGNMTRNHQLETRGRFISKLMERAEGMLFEGPDSARSTKENETRAQVQTTVSTSDSTELKNATSKSLSGNAMQERICTSTARAEHSSKKPNSTEPDPTTRVPGTNNPLYIDIMVNEAFRVFKSPPSDEEIEKQDTSISFDSPGEKKERSMCNSPRPSVIRHNGTDSFNIPAAASLLSDPTNIDKVASTSVVSEPTKDKSGPCLEKPRNSTPRHIQTSEPQPAQTYTQQPTQTATLQNAPNSTPHSTQNCTPHPTKNSAPQPNQNSTTTPLPQRSPTVKVKLSDVRVTVRPLQPIAPKPVIQLGSPIHIQAVPRVFAEGLTKVPPTNQQSKSSTADDLRDSSSESTCFAPNFLIPTEDGFRRMQKVDGKTQEIYRVTVQSQEGVQAPISRKQFQKVYSVYYREMTFPCVLRTDVPFVPTLLLVQDLFPGIKASEVCKAMQHCNILNRYMIRHEQEALQEPLRRRGITSCKLLPLDEFHDKWEEILHHIPNTQTLGAQNEEISRKT